MAKLMRSLFSTSESFLALPFQKLTRIVQALAVLARVWAPRARGKQYMRIQYADSCLVGLPIYTSLCIIRLDDAASRQEIRLPLRKTPDPFAWEG